MFERQGRRYLFGRSNGEFGIWRRVPGGFAVRAGLYPATEDGWQQARAHYVRLEPQSEPAAPDLSPRLVGRWALAGCAAGIVAVVLAAVVGAVLLVARTSPPHAISAAQDLTARPGPDSTLASAHSGRSSAGASTSPAPDAHAGAGWLAAGASEVDFVQWARSGNQASGTVFVSSLTARGSQVSGTRAPFTATLSGQDVALVIPQGLGFQATLTGTLIDGVLRLNSPSSDGGLSTSVFTPATAAAYDAAVRTLQATAQRNGAAAAAARTRAAQAEADSHAAQARDSAVATTATAVDDDLTNVSQALTQAQSDASQATGDVGEVTSALAQTRTDAAAVASEVGEAGEDPDSVCADADGVASDADGVDSAMDSVQSDVSAQSAAASQLATAVTTLEQDQRALDAAVSADPSYTPTGGVPSTSTIDDAASSARSADAAASAAAAQAVRDAQALATHAHTLATQAVAAGHCS